MNQTFCIVTLQPALRLAVRDGCAGWVAGRSLLLGAVLLARLSAEAAPFTEPWFTEAFQLPATTVTTQTADSTGVLKLGPLMVDAGAIASLEYTTNINSSSNTKSGTEITGGITFATAWEAVQGNQLSLSGEWVRDYWLYGAGPNLWSLVLEPGSTLRHTVRVAGVEVTPFVDLSRTIDPGLAPTVSHAAIFEQANYDGGVEVSVPLRNMTFQLLALRGLAIEGGDGQEDFDSDRRMASARIIRSLQPGLRSGFEVYAIGENFKNGAAESSTANVARIFSAASLRNGLQLYAAIGVESAKYSHSLLAGDSNRDVQLVGDVQLVQRMRENLTCTLRVADQAADNYTSDYYRDEQADISPAIYLNEYTLLTLDAGLHHIIESLGPAAGGDVWEYDADLQFSVSDKLRLSFEIRSLNSMVGPTSNAFRQTNFVLKANRQF